MRKSDRKCSVLYSKDTYIFQSCTRFHCTISIQAKGVFVCLIPRKLTGKLFQGQIIQQALTALIKTVIKIYTHSLPPIFHLPQDLGLSLTPSVRKNYPWPQQEVSAQCISCLLQCEIVNLVTAIYKVYMTFLLLLFKNTAQDCNFICFKLITLVSPLSVSTEDLLFPLLGYGNFKNGHSKIF